MDDKTMTTDPQSLAVELPPPVGWVHHSGQLQDDRKHGHPVFDENALLSFATACVLAEREACAALVDALAHDKRPALTVADCAAAIRERKQP